MFICRHRLLRSYVLKTSAFTPSYGPFTSEHLSYNNLQHTRHRRHQSSCVPKARDVSDVEGRVAAATSFVVEVPGGQTAVSHSGLGKGLGTMKVDSHLWHSQPVTAFLKVHNQDRTKIADVPPVHLLRFIQAATRLRNPNYIDHFVQDVLMYYPASGRFQVLVALLAITQHHQKRLLRKDKLHLVVQALAESGKLSDVPSDVLRSAAMTIVLTPPDPDKDPPLILALSPLLVDLAVQSCREPKSSNIPLDDKSLWPVLAFVQRLATFGEKQKALNLLKTVMQNNFIPSRVMNSVDLSSADFGHITTSILVHACLERGWFSQALSLLTEAVTWQDTLHPDLFQTILSVIHHLLHRRQEGDLHLAASMIVRLLSSPEKSPLPHHILDRVLILFYQQAQKTKNGAMMETVYGLTRSPTVLARYSYVAPSGHSLLWFFNYCTKESRNFGTARLLAKQVVENDMEIPYYDRPVLIASFASAGFATQARQLWERLTTRPGAQIILGNAATMLRLVSLFSSLARHQDQLNHSGGASFHETVNVALDQVNATENNIEEGARIIAQLLTLRQVSKERNTTSDVKGTNMVARIPTFDFDKLDNPLLNPPESPVRPSSETLSSSPGWSAEERGQDFRAFAYRVVAMFRKSKQPLRSASHFDLNALARAYFLMGEHVAGLDVLTALLHREELPDIRDVNVALSAVAARNPAKGASVLNHMMEVGLWPDAVSLGTVIHHALLRGDIVLVKRLLFKARKLNITDLTFKTMGRLIRSSAAGQGSHRRDAQEDLKVAKDLVDAILDIGSIPSPRMGTDCVTTALHADDPVMAFEFWKTLVKDKVDWNGDKQRRIRRLIAQEIRRHCAQKILDWKKGHTMLAELGQKAS